MTPGPDDERVIVCTPSANDGPVTAQLLAAAGIHPLVVTDLEAASAALGEGGAALIMAEEALRSKPGVERLVAHLAGQGPWSDLPVLLCTGGHPPRRPGIATLEHLETLGNVTVLERPLQVLTLVSAVRAALRARRRQYAARDLLVERQRATEALRQSDERKTEFLGVLSHELRNPLAPIRTGVVVLQRAPSDSPQARRAREVIGRQIDHLARLVDDLLDVTRISRGKIELRRTRLDVAEVVRRAVEDHRALFDAKGMELELDAPGPLWVDGDGTRLAQVVGNLVQNALKFSQPGQPVSVTARKAGGEVLLEVLDRGGGIEPELLPHVFEAFVQADRGLARGHGGLGLGLALVKGITELHGGRVEAHSEGPGTGARFTIRLPAAAAPEQASAAGPDGTERRPLKVLVIEDNRDSARTLADLLELEGHAVEVAWDGRSGLDRARSARPQVIICDLGLPDLDGFEVARQIRADRSLDGTFLVALSGYAQPDDRVKSRSAGFDRHLAKPATSELLLGVLGSVARS